MLRLSAEHLDRLLRSSGQLLTESLRQDQVARELSELSRQVEGLGPRVGVGPQGLRGAASTGWGRCPSSPGSSATWNSPGSGCARRSARRGGSACSSSAARGRSASWARRSSTTSAARGWSRPTASFKGFRKMVRDLARDEGKEVEFRVTGFEVQADRLVLQALKDPLMHIAPQRRHPRDRAARRAHGAGARARSGGSRSGSRRRATA